MENKLYYSTVEPLLQNVLKHLMEMDELSSFRLVGGTALSLQLGHRKSVDIDLFSDVEYGSVDFLHLDKKLQKIFPYVDMLSVGNDAFGKSYYVGNSEKESVKVDVFYTDSFTKPTVTNDFIRMASIEEIAAMKMEVIGNGGRKKDFWDVHELLNILSIDAMLQLHAERHPYSHTSLQLIEALTNFEIADSDFDPICMRGKYWEVVKLDLIKLANNLS